VSGDKLAKLNNISFLHALVTLPKGFEYAKSLNNKRVVLFFIILAPVILLLLYVIPFFLHLLHWTIGYFFISMMIITVAVVLISPIFFPFERWKLDMRCSELIQVNATVIAGILFFLTLTSSTSEIKVTDLFNPLNTLTTIKPKSLMISLTTLTILPFTFSSILLYVWGQHRIWSKQRSIIIRRHEGKWETIPVNISVTGQLLGATFTIAGFVWLIVSMILFLSIGIL